MTNRITKRTLRFTRPFVLDGIEGEQPAGDYEVETDEELVEGVSFPAYRRISTLIHLHPRPESPGVTETLAIDPAVLEAALERAGAHPAPAAPGVAAPNDATVRY